MQFDLDQVDALLTTTRAVRRRLDLTRPVPDDVLYECLRLAIQAPTGSNTQNWRWLVVRDASKRAALADLYRRAGQGYLTDRVASLEPGTELHKVLDSSLFLAEHLHEVRTHRGGVFTDDDADLWTHFCPMRSAIVARRRSWSNSPLMI